VVTKFKIERGDEGWWVSRCVLGESVVVGWFALRGEARAYVLRMAEQSLGGV
jgi:hypothetical protein